MAKKFSLEIIGNNDEQPLKSGTPFSSLKRYSNYIRSLMGGARTGAVTVRCRNDEVAATGTITMAISSGTVGAIINGVTVTVTWATSDTVSSALLAAAINASTDALVQNIVTATSSGAVTTITSYRPGTAGNTITLAATGANVTASAVRLTGGTATLFNYSF